MQVMRSRRHVGLVLAGAGLLAACGSEASEPAPTTMPAPAVTEAPAQESAEDPAPATTVDAASAPEAAPAPATSVVAEAEPEAAPTTTAAPEPTTTLAPEPEPAPLGGRELGEALRPESAEGSNPLPDLLVDDIRRGTQVNVANLIPAQRPVLVWAWAPH